MAKQRKLPTLADLTENNLEWTSKEPESMTEGRRFTFRCPYRVLKKPLDKKDPRTFFLVSPWSEILSYLRNRTIPSLKGMSKEIAEACTQSYFREFVARDKLELPFLVFDEVTPAVYSKPLNLMDAGPPVNVLETKGVYHRINPSRVYTKISGGS